MTDLFSKTVATETVTDEPAWEPRPLVVLKARLPEFEEAWAKLAKKAGRYGQRISYELGEEYKEHRTFPNGAEGRVTVIPITVTGEAPQIAGWTFLAKVEPVSGGRCMVSTVPGLEADLPHQYRTTDMRCEHCHQDRRRKDVFVLRHEDGRHIQVGRTCLRDFLGTDTPEKLAWRFAWFPQFREEGEGSWGWAEHLLVQRDVLAVTHAVIRVEGWTSKGQAYERETIATASHVADWFSHSPKTRARAQEIFPVSEADEAIADATLGWLRELAEKGDHSDYEWNLTLATEDELVEQRRLGLVCSAVAGYMRSAELALRVAREAEAAAESTWVGQVKERLRAVQATLETTRVVSAGYGYYDDPTRLLKFRTEDGAVLTWFTSAAEHLEPGTLFTMDFTVKEHTEFRGAKETRITRAKLAAI